MRKNQHAKRFMLLSSFILTSSLCFAQVTEKWVGRYNGPMNHADHPFALAVDNLQNVYVTGYSWAIGSVSDYATIKYNKEGVKLWVARYNGPANSFDDAMAIVVDNAGNVYVTGASVGTGTGISDYATIKYNASGVQQWVARYNGPNNAEDGANAIAVDNAGNVYVTGRSGLRISNFDYLTVKYNAAGIQQWVARYNGTANNYDQAFDIAVDGAGNIYVTGGSDGLGTWEDFTTIKYTTTGALQWVTRYNGPVNSGDEAIDLVLDPLEKNIFVTGRSNNGLNSDFATVKYKTSTGVQLWAARYNGPANNNDNAKSLAVDGGGNVYVTGDSPGIGTSTDYATIKYNSAGVQLWVARYNGPAGGGDLSSSLALDGSSNVYVTGVSPGIGTSWDYATIKYNSLGTTVWETRYNGPANAADQGNRIAVDASGNVYVTGYSDGIETHYDYATIKYVQTAARAPGPVSMETESVLPSKFQVINYPNPATVTTRIDYELPFDGRVSIKVYDLLGREVTTLVNADKKAGYHSTRFNASLLQTGVYHYNAILTGGQKILTQAGKITVIK